MQGLFNKVIKYLQGVGPKRSELLNKELNIYTYKDLLFYYPYKYIDKSKYHIICDLDANMQYVQIKGQIISYEIVGQKFKKRLVAYFSDGTGTIELIWFKGIKWVIDILIPGKDIIIFGKPTIFNNKFNIAHPEIEDFKKNADDITATL